MEPPLVDVSGVRRTYDGFTALDGVSLQIAAGELVTVYGPSGSGKSTLLNVIGGLDRPNGGSITIKGADITKLSEARLAQFRRAHIGFVFQFFNLLANLTALENVVLPAQLLGRKTNAARERARELLDQLGLTQRLHAYPTRLSGGEQQRVAIARALINDPVILLADEPTGALDSRSGQQVMDLLADFNTAGQTVVLVTHDPGLAVRSTRVVSLRDRQVVDDTMLNNGQDAEAGKLFAAPAAEEQAGDSYAGG